MRIATFNLESFGNDRHAEAAALDQRIEVLRPQIERLKADVLCLQEVNGQHRSGAQHRTLDALDLLLAGTEYAQFDRISTLGPDGVGVADIHNLVTLSRWPIVERNEVRNTLLPPLSYRAVSACPPLPGPIEITFDRAVLVATVRRGGGPDIDILNLHLRAPLAMPIAGQKEAPFVWKSVSGWAEGFFLSGVKRSAQALETRLMIDRMLDRDPHRRIVVAGDFNSEDHETPVRLISGAEEDTGNGNLAARSLTVLDRQIPGDRRFTVLHHGRHAMLDHILSTRAMLANFRFVEAHNETLGDEVIAYGRTHRSAQSFHAPLVAEFADD